jgi:hypothetical protein
VIYASLAFWSFCKIVNVCMSVLCVSVYVCACVLFFSFVSLELLQNCSFVFFLVLSFLLWKVETLTSLLLLPRVFD